MPRADIAPPRDALAVVRAALGAHLTPGERARWRLEETPRAWVLVTGPVAYKVFKPEAAARPADRCARELSLGRALAPDLYLDVVYLHGAPAVRMRAFEPWQRLDRRAALGDLTVADVEGLGLALATFHASAPGAVHGALSLAKAARLSRGVALFGPAPRPEPRDPLADVAALALDVSLAGAPALAWRLINRWTAESGCTHAALALPIHLALCALARSAREPAGAGAVLAAARRLTAPRAPALVVTVGLSGTGKSTVAVALAGALEAWLLRSDCVRKSLMGLRPGARTHSPLDGGAYTPSMSERTYAALRERAAASLAAGRSVVADACFLTRAQRAGMAAVARAQGVPLVWLVFQADPEVLEARVRTRVVRGGDPSEADLAVLERQRAAFEPLDAAEAGTAVVVSTNGPVDVVALARRVAGTRLAEEGAAEVMSMNTTGEGTLTCLTAGGRIVEMIRREQDDLQLRFEAFRNEWTQRSRFHAAVALNRFREALARHVRWEEESLFEEYEKCCEVGELYRVHQHHLEHERLLRLACQLDQDVAETMLPSGAPALEAKIDAAAVELQEALVAHRQVELHEVGCRLDAALTGEQIEMIAGELEERGQPLS